jgi:DNA-binding NtrC family response regulator
MRRKIHKVADPSLILGFELALTEMAAKLGLGSRARRHLDAAVALLPTVSDRAVHADVKLAQIALAAWESDFSTALQHAFDLVPIAEETGCESARFGASNNLGHLLHLHARSEEAQDWLLRGLRERNFGGGPEIALRDTLMSLQISLGHLDEACLEADAVEGILKATGSRESYYGLWHLLTRVKLLYRTNRDDAGLAVAMDALPRIQRMADRNLFERMQLLAAEGLGRIGRATEGAQLLAAAVTTSGDRPLEMIAEAARVAGRLAALDDPVAAAGHFNHAARILRAVGNLTACAEIERDARETGTPIGGGINGDAASAYLQPLDDPPPRPVRDRRPPAAALTERLAALIDLGAHPPLLATETLSLIADTGAALHVRVTETAADGTSQVLAMEGAADAPPWRDRHPDLVSIALGSHRDRHVALAALPRPSATARATLLAVERLVHTALALAHARQQEREQMALWPEPSPEQQLGLVCASERMMGLVKSVRRIAPSNVTVLISGETGVGKELFARALHQASARSDRVFLPFNCATVPRDIIDSQLFGYRRGAFTGAHDDSPGLIRSAAGGTLFLDEIGDMSAEAQPKLLRFLETGEVMPLGATRPQLVDVRVVAATNANLEQLVAEGRFREDLYYRLNVIPLNVPPLRERREEIPLLVDHFIDKFSHELQKTALRVSEEALEYLVLYRWPGNVRQLANEVRRLVALAESGAVLMPEHLSPAIAASRRTVPADQRALKPTEIVMRLDQPMAAATEHLERALIQRALLLCDGKVDDAARMLGLSRKGLYLKRQRLGIE